MALARVIEVDAQDHDGRLLAFACQAFAQRGGEVIVRPEDDANWVRRRPGGDGADFEIVVAGLPNLLHELGHAALFDGLADDHGIDYGLIPLRLEVDCERRILWEELASSVISCAYLGRAAAETDAWFAEQVEIQGIFYGVDGDLPALRRLFRAALDVHHEEAEAVIALAYARCEAWLRGAGAPPEIARPRRQFFLAELWSRHEALRGA